MITLFDILVIIILVIYLGITWFLPECIGYVLKRKFNIKIHFGQIGLPFPLRDVNICKSEFLVHINEIGIRSSIFNSEVTKLLLIDIRDVRISKEEPEQQPSPTSSNSSNEGTTSSDPSGSASSGGGRRVLNFLNKIVHPMIIKLVQCTAVTIYNVSIPQLKNNHLFEELHFDGKQILECYDGFTNFCEFWKKEIEGGIARMFLNSTVWFVGAAMEFYFPRASEEPTN